MEQYILALDQGTSSSRAIVFDRKGLIRSVAQREFTQLFPKPGWVEHNPHEIWSSQASVIAEAIAAIDINGLNIAGIGITTMKETAGVGTRVKEPAFLRQFPGKAVPVKLRSQGGDIDAVSGATISSNAVITAVASAVDIYTELKPLLLETWK